MLLSAVSVLVAAQSSSEIPEGLMNNPVFLGGRDSVVCTATRILVGTRFYPPVQTVPGGQQFFL